MYISKQLNSWVLSGWATLLGRGPPPLRMASLSLRSHGPSPPPASRACPVRHLQAFPEASRVGDTVLDPGWAPFL